MCVFDVARTPNGSVKEYVETIDYAPVLTSCLLSLTNSAFTPSAPPFSSCQEAVTRVGLDATLAAVLSFSLFRQKDLSAYLQRL